MLRSDKRIGTCRVRHAAPSAEPEGVPDQILIAFVAKLQLQGFWRGEARGVGVGPARYASLGSDRRIGTCRVRHEALPAEPEGPPSPRGEGGATGLPGSPGTLPILGIELRADLRGRVVLLRLLAKGQKTQPNATGNGFKGLRLTENRKFVDDKCF